MDQNPPKDTGGGPPAKKDQDEDDRDENLHNEGFRVSSGESDSEGESESGEIGDENYIEGIDTTNTTPRNPNLRF